MSNELPTSQPSGAEVLQARLWQAVQDLGEGRVTPAEANRITKQTRKQLRMIEASLHVEKLRRLYSEP